MKIVLAIAAVLAATVGCESTSPTTSTFVTEQGTRIDTLSLSPPLAFRRAANADQIAWGFQFRHVREGTYTGLNRLRIDWPDGTMTVAGHSRLSDVSGRGDNPFYTEIALFEMTQEQARTLAEATGPITLTFRGPDAELTPRVLSQRQAAALQRFIADRLRPNAP